MGVISNCSNCNNILENLYYIKDKNGNLHLHGTCINCKKPQFIPRIDNLKIPIFRKGEARNFLKNNAQKSFDNAQISIF